MGNRVVHFEIPSDKPEESIAFFKKVFGWNFQQFGDEPYWLAMTGDENEPGINGAIMKKKHPQQPLVNSIKVTDLKATLRLIEEEGGQIVVPTMAIPTVGWLAFFKDMDGNIHGVTQEDKNAK